MGKESFSYKTSIFRMQLLFQISNLKKMLFSGEAYAFDNDLYDYYNVSVYSRSFVREQVIILFYFLKFFCNGKNILRKLFEADTSNSFLIRY